MLAKVLKLPIKLQTGYNGSEDQLAMRRGEIVGSVASRSSWEAFVKNGYGHRAGPANLHRTLSGVSA